MADTDDHILTDDEFAAIRAQMRAAWERRGLPAEDAPQAIQMYDASLAFAERHRNGFLVALWLDADTAAELALPDGEPAEALHITLAYAGDIEDIGELTTARAITSLERDLWWRTPITGKVGGYGRFLASDTSDGKDVFYAAVDMPGLDDLRMSVLMALSEAGVYAKTDHGFTPHVTLAYLDPDAANPVDTLPPVKLRFRAVTIVAGDRRVDISLSDTLAFAEVASLHPARGVGKDGMRFRDFRRPLTFTGADTWVQFLPPPGTYHHILYGELDFTADKYQRIVDNFQSGIYGQTLPINAEHDGPATGAIGYITDMRIADDGSIEVKPDWNDRGRQLIEGDRFRYVSAELFDQWQDPVTGDWHQDVAFGMAICTNPHFKETVLRPLAASEARRAHDPADRREGDDGMTHPEKTPSGQKPGDSDNRTVTLAEDDLKQLRETAGRVEAAEKRAETLEAQNTELAERIGAMEQAARRQRFTDLVGGRGGSNDGQPWFGDPGAHVDLLETLANQFGEDSDEVKRYTEQQTAIASQLRASQLFSEIGTSRSGDNDVETKLNAAVEKIRESNPKLTREQAVSQAYSEHADLYEAEMKGVRDGV